MSRSLAAFTTAALLLASAMALSACNTTAGAGKDISNTGKAISNGADTVQQKL